MLNWGQVDPGTYRVMRSGGTFEVYFRGAHPQDAARLVNALRQAGFRDVEPMGNVLVRARKP